MAIGLKTAGVLGSGALIVLGASITEQAPESSVTPSQVAVPVSSSKITPVTIETSPAKSPNEPLREQAPVRKNVTTNDCHPGYSGCLKTNSGDYDCAGGSGNGPNYTETVQVFGSDPFDLDRDDDGWGCE